MRFLPGLTVTLAGAFVAVVVTTGILAAWIAPHDPYDQTLNLRLISPFTSSEFLLGTDYLGRDILSRMILGARYSLLVGFTTSLASTIIGVVIGLTGGYWRRVDAFVSALINARLAFPFILLLLVLVAVLGPSLNTTVLTLSATLWVRHAVVIRNQVQVIREQEYVEAARALGARDTRIVLRHVLVGVLPQITVLSTLIFSEAILAESFLSFLGLGVQLPTPSWGNMIAEGRLYALNKWWLAGIPGAAIFLTTLSINAIGDAIQQRWV